MILLIDTSNSVCKMSLISDDKYDIEWEAGRTLARDLLKFIDNNLKERNFNFSDISAIGVFEGPGSFTGLRIGITVMNTLAEAISIPIVGSRGADWQAEALRQIKAGKNQKIVLPFYGSEAKITISKK